MDNFNTDQEPEQEEYQREPELNPIMSPLKAAFFSVIGVFFLYQIGGSILMLLIFGMDFQNADINALRLLTVGGQILLILLPALWLAKLVYEDVGTIIRFRFPAVKEVVIFIIGLIILTPLLQNFLYIQNYLFEIAASNSSVFESIKSFFDTLNEYVEETYGSLIKADSIFEASFVVVVIAITPAICEEVFFRGFVQKSFEFRMKPAWAALITALFFALYHFNPYGLIPLIVLGFYLGYTSYVSNSIFIPVILHFLNNFFAVMLFFLFGEEELTSSTPANFESLNFHFISFIVLLILFIIFTVYVKKNYHKLIGGQNDLS
jgi:membrane protease YdiL (CAAX protease family)